METFESGVSKLSIFEQIHAEGHKEAIAATKLNTSECDESTGEAGSSSESTNGSADEYSMEFDLQQFYLSD